MGQSVGYTAIQLASCSVFHTVSQLFSKTTGQPVWQSVIWLASKQISLSIYLSDSQCVSQPVGGLVSGLVGGSVSQLSFYLHQPAEVISQLDVYSQSDGQSGSKSIQ